MQITQQFNCSQIDFDAAKSRDDLSLTCLTCTTAYFKSKKNILNKFKTRGTYPMFCSNKCQGAFRTKTYTKLVVCTNCQTNFQKKDSDISKTKNNFCSRSCSVTFNNKNKSHGIRRSKFEIQLENCLLQEFPNLKFLFSNKKIIGSELDIYIPTLQLGFEIQGIFHYEPIFGQEKLNQIQKNDQNKEVACKELGITLIKLDISKLKRCTENTVKPYNEKVFDEIKSRLPSYALMSPA